VQTSLEQAAFTSWHQLFDWEEDLVQVLVQVLEKGAEATVHIRHSEKLREKLIGLVEELPADLQERFDPELMLVGYSSFLKTSTEMKGRDSELQPHEIYYLWYKVKILFLENCIFCLQVLSHKSESHAVFALLFQNYQIRTSSEVIILSPLKKLNIFYRPWQRQ
jgi:hypothetical protein